MIKSIQRFFSPTSTNTFYTIEMGDISELLSSPLMLTLIDDIINKLATKYVEDHGDLILRSIHEKVTDSKVIEKVIANLRKELKNGNK